MTLTSHRIAAILTAAAATLGCAAQRPAAHPEPPLFDTSRSERFIEVQPYVGVGIAAVAQNYSTALPGVTDIMMAPGVRLSFGVDVRFNINRGFGIGTGASYDINNMRYSMSVVDNNTGSINSMYSRSHFYSLTFPVYLSWRFNLGRRMVWNLDPGWYFSYGTGGNTKISGYSSGENSLGQPVITHASYRFKYYNDRGALINGVKDFDHGVRIATGLTYRNHYSFNIVYQIGVTNVALNQGNLDVRYHNMSLMFNLGYTF